MQRRTPAGCEDRIDFTGGWEIGGGVLLDDDLRLVKLQKQVVSYQTWNDTLPEMIRTLVGVPV